VEKIHRKYDSISDAGYIKYMLNRQRGKIKENNKEIETERRVLQMLGTNPAKNI
jgi:hypothetical protein